ncbi:RNA helicase CrhR [Pseudoclavibacter triregionum]|nr:RNA helicase CrhR [Pseudoclavibacter triregionum]
MPKGKGGFRPAKNYVPRDGAKGGRPYRPARPGDVPRRARPVDGAERGGFDRPERGGYQGRPQRDDRGFGRRDDREGGYQGRPQRDDRGFGRRDDREGGYQGRPQRDDRGSGRRDDRDGGARVRDDRGFEGRPQRDDRDGGYRGRDDRQGYQGRPQRDDRAGYQGRRDDREGGYQGRPQRDDRGFQGRDDRQGGYQGRPQRDDRGGYQGRPQRDDRGFQGRPQRDDRDGGFDGRGGDDRPQRFDRDDRPQRDDRPRHDRADRDDRPQRDERRDDRRPARHDDDFQAARSRFREERRDRPQRGNRDDRGARDQRSGASARPQQLTEDVVLARFNATPITAEAAEGVEFADLGLGEEIIGALAGLGAESPFPIQVATIPDVLGGRDVLGRGRTGSGKTIAFGAPLVERLLMLRGDDRNARRRIGRAPRALIVAPTRELALQIDRTIQPIARSVGLFTTQVYGGVPQQRQVTALRRGVDIIIGTPGRIEDLERQGHLDLSDIRITVLDEADQMCDLGFLEPVQRILRMTKPGGQKLLFSATLDQAVLQLVDEFLVDAAVHEVAGETDQHTDIDHRVLVVERGDRDPIIEQLARSGGRVLIFTRTRLGAEKVADELEDAGVRAVALHGDLNQAKRQRNLQQLTSGRVDVLVATDVAARGIHVDDIRLVLQADMPEEYKTYLHRSGRTGRAGNRGTVITFIAPARRKKMAALLDRAGIDAPMIPARPGGRELDEFSLEASQERDEQLVAERAEAKAERAEATARAAEAERVEAEQAVAGQTAAVEAEARADEESDAIAEAQDAAQRDEQ